MVAAEIPVYESLPAKTGFKHRNETSFLLAALKDCSVFRDLERGRRIHSDAVQAGADSNFYIASSLVNMYAKCGSLSDARRVFDAMTGHNVVSWTALIQGYVENGEAEIGLSLFGRPLQGCKPNGRTFVAALKGCISLAVKDEGELLEGQVVKFNALQQGNSLVDMYASCGSLVDAKTVFDRMAYRDVVSWTSLIMGYAENGEEEVALDLFTSMRSEGCQGNARTFVAALKACVALAEKQQGDISGKLLERVMALHSQAAKTGCQDLFVAAKLVDLYARCGCLEDSRRVFDEMSCRDLVLWTSLLLAYARNGEEDSALELFLCMLAEGQTPDASAFAVVLQSCGDLAALELGKAVHSQICRRGLESGKVLMNCVVDFYSKCGNIVDSLQVFDSLYDDSTDLLTWTSLLAGLSRQGGSFKQVFALFHEMLEKGLQVDGVSLLCVLTTCGHAGFVEKGLEHYNAVIDLLGRANQLSIAVEYIKAMPFTPSSVTWTTLLGSCWKWTNVEYGRLAFESLLETNVRNAAAYILMGNIYRSRGMFEEQASIEAMRISAGALRKRGKSRWIDEAGKIHSWD